MMNDAKSIINLIPVVYRKNEDLNINQIQDAHKNNSDLSTLVENKKVRTLVKIIDGFIGRGELNSHLGTEKDTKLGLYERSDYLNDLYSLKLMRQHYKSGKFSQLFDGTIQDYIRWFCEKSDVYLDDAWVSSMDPDIESSSREDILTLDQVFEKISLCLYLSRKRGTLHALLGFLNIYLPAISQANSTVTGSSTQLSSIKIKPKVYDARDFTNLRYEQELTTSNSFVIVYDKAYLSPTANYDFMVRVVYNGVNPEEMSKFIASAKTIVIREKPAHTKFCLHVISKAWQLNKAERSELAQTTLVSGEFKEIY